MLDLIVSKKKTLISEASAIGFRIWQLFPLPSVSSTNACVCAGAAPSNPTPPTAQTDASIDDGYAEFDLMSFNDETERQLRAEVTKSARKEKLVVLEAVKSKAEEVARLMRNKRARKQKPTDVAPLATEPPRFYQKKSF